MSESSVNICYISEKIAKTRWVKEEGRLLTGSWNMPKNFVRIWHLQKNQYVDDFCKYSPHCCDQIPFKGDITGMEFVSPDVVAVGCADGTVTLLKVLCGNEEDSLKEVGRSPLLHKFNSDERPAPCTAISVYQKDIATVGEDGRLNIIDTATASLVHKTIDADSCTLMSVAYINPKEVLTANIMGLINMFDVRASAESMKTASFVSSSQDDKRSNYVSCLASYPTQPHIVLAGSEEGSITVWDLRKPGFPASYLSAHNRAITEIGFHRTDPTKLLTASESGELWLWSQQSLLSMHATKEGQANENVNPWLNGEHAKNRINVTALVSNLRKSVNTFDVAGSKIVCGGDNEALHFIDNVI